MATFSDQSTSSVVFGWGGGSGQFVFSFDGVLPAEWFAPNTSSADRTLTGIDLYDDGEVGWNIGGGKSVNLLAGVRNRLKWTLTASNGSSVTVRGVGGSDTREPYFWTPSNSAEIIAFGTTVNGLTDKSVSLTVVAVAKQVVAPAFPAAVVAGGAPQLAVDFTQVVEVAPAFPAAVVAGGAPQLAVDFTQVVGVAPAFPAAVVAGEAWTRLVVLLTEQPEYFAVAPSFPAATVAGGNLLLSVFDPASLKVLQWHDGAPDVTLALPVLWRSERRIIGSPDPGDPKEQRWGDWSEPVVVGRFGHEGIPGADGEDAHGVEYIFTAYSSATLPASRRPDNAWGFDEPGTRGEQQWHDGAPSLSSTSPYLLRCQRDILGAPDKGDAVSDNWSLPSVVGRYGLEGAAGEDGAGVEYIFTAYSSATLPASRRPDNAWGFDEPGTRGGQQWHDGAPGLTARDPFLFRAERPVPGIPAAGASVSAEWSLPVVVGRFGADGEDGAPGEQGAPGQDARDPAAFYPFTYGLPYRNRNQNDAHTPGSWVAYTGSKPTSVKGDLGTQTGTAWADVTRLEFHGYDSTGRNRGPMFKSPDLQEANRLIAIKRFEPAQPGVSEASESMVVFRTTGEITEEGSGVKTHYRIPVTGMNVPDPVDDEWSDGETIVPPHDSQYEIVLCLPELRFGPEFFLPRWPGHFLVRVEDALLATALAGTEDDEAWPAGAVTLANDATPGKNIAGDIVTLYRGEQKWTRAWDPVNEVWSHFTGFEGGLLVALGGITTPYLGVGAVTAEKIAANAITAEKIAANAITAEKIAANAITAEKIAANAIVARTIGSEEIISRHIRANQITADQISSNVNNVFVVMQSDTGLRCTTGQITRIDLVQNVRKYDFLHIIVSDYSDADITGDGTSESNVGQDFASFTIPIRAVKPSVSFTGNIRRARTSGVNVNFYFFNLAENGRSIDLYVTGNCLIWNVSAIRQPDREGTFGPGSIQDPVITTSTSQIGAEITENVFGYYFEAEWAENKDFSPVKATAYDNVLGNTHAALWTPPQEETPPRTVPQIWVRARFNTEKDGGGANGRWSVATRQAKPGPFSGQASGTWLRDFGIYATRPITITWGTPFPVSEYADLLGSYALTGWRLSFFSSGQTYQGITSPDLRSSINLPLSTRSITLTISGDSRLNSGFWSADPNRPFGRSLKYRYINVAVVAINAAGETAGRVEGLSPVWYY